MVCRFCNCPIVFSWAVGDYVHCHDDGQICDLNRDHPLFMIAIATPDE